MYAPAPNDGLFDIQHWPAKMCTLNGINLKINMGYLLVMTNLRTLGNSVHKLLVRQSLELDCHYDLDLSLT